MSENAPKRLKSYFEDLLHDRTKLIRILLIVSILFLALILRMHEDSKADITVDSSAQTSSSDRICVDIGGAVVNPGVYTVDRETRLYEVIELAGGLISSADTESINRAEYVEDGEKIIIPSKPVYADTQDGTDGDRSEASSDKETVSGEPESAPASAGMQNGLININYASREELKTLPGIGDAKADKIIEYRSSKKFKKKEDIKSVNGIGDSIYDKIKDSITV